MFNLMSLFRSKTSLPDDETIVNHIQPYAKLEVTGNQPIALYRTKTRILVTHPIATFAGYFWLPKNSSLKTVKTTAEIYFKGHADGWEGCKYWQPIFDEGAARQAAWLAIPEEERRLYEPVMLDEHED